MPFPLDCKVCSKVLRSMSSMSDAATVLLRVRQALRRSMTSPAEETLTTVLRRVLPTIRLTPAMHFATTLVLRPLSQVKGQRKELQRLELRSAEISGQE